MTGTPVERVRALMAEVFAEVAAIPSPMHRAHALHELIAYWQRVEPALCLFRDQTIKEDRSMPGHRTVGRPTLSLGTAEEAAAFIGCTPSVIHNARRHVQPCVRYRGAGLGLIELRTGQPVDSDAE